VTTEIQKTGRQFLGATIALLLIGGLALLPVLPMTEGGDLSVVKSAFLYGGMFLILLSVATGLVSVIYLISGVVEFVGFLTNRQVPSRGAEQSNGGDAERLRAPHS